MHSCLDVVLSREDNRTVGTALTKYLFGEQRKMQKDNINTNKKENGCEDGR